MANYALMYYKLFDAQTKVIELLQQAQRDTEEIYVSSPEPGLHILTTQKEHMDKKE